MPPQNFAERADDERRGNEAGIDAETKTWKASARRRSSLIKGKPFVTNVRDQLSGPPARFHGHC
jgi:hypothetical protein